MRISAAAPLEGRILSQTLVIYPNFGIYWDNMVRFNMFAWRIHFESFIHVDV